MRRSHTLYFLITLSLTLLISACSYRPVERIAETEAAREQAKSEHADQFAIDEWKDAEEAWTEAQGLLNAEKYGNAAIVLLKAKSRYEKARDIAQGRREDLIKEVQGLQKTAQLRCKALKEGIDSGGKKLTAERKKKLEDICLDVEAKIAKVSSQLDEGQYQDAKFLAQKTLREVWEAQMELESYLGKKLSS